MMTVAEIMKKMIAYSEGNHHDINHLMKVWGFARTIGSIEQLDTETQYILEVAAIVHDIACPLCRKKYGCTDGPLQEREGEVLAREFLQDTGMTQVQIDRVAYLVGHHHTLTDIQGMDYQILIEADYLVNADESSFSRSNIENFRAHCMKTATGRALLDEIYLRAE